MVSSIFMCIIVPIIMIFLIFYAAHQRRNEVKQAHTNYQSSLEDLKLQPTNADLKQNTLTLGRRYSNLTRNRRGVTLYDEIALMNDINAATTSVPNVGQSTKTMSIEERIKQLGDLKDKGIISEQEFNAQRQKILEEL